MHIFFPVARRVAAEPGASGSDESVESVDAGQIYIVRDPDDESEWQYLGNPEIAARTSLADVVARFIQDCSGADGAIDKAHLAAATKVRDALLLAAKQIDDALARTGR